MCIPHMRNVAAMHTQTPLEAYTNLFLGLFKGLHHLAGDGTH